MSLTASFCSIYPQYLMFLSFFILFWWIKLSPYQHQCCTVSLITSFCSINPQCLPFLSIFLHDFLVRPHKKKFSLSSYPAKKCRAGGRIFLLFFIFFVWPSPTAAYNFKAIKQSINKTKLLFIDRLGEKAIIQSTKSCQSFYTRRSSSYMLLDIFNYNKVKKISTEIYIYKLLV